MRHEAVLRRLDELDAGKDYGLALTWHLKRCEACSVAAARVEAALRAYREDTRREDTRCVDTAAPDPALETASLLEDRVMAAVRLLHPPRQDFAIRDWLFPGAVLAVSMFLLPIFGKDLGFLGSFFGPGYALSLSLVLGVALTAYVALFIATHLDELQSFLEKRGLMPR